jgi:hypothetical protein
VEVDPGAAATATTMTVPTQVLVWSTVAGAQARLDGAAAAPLPLVREVAPGSHAVVVNAPGHEDSTLDVVAVADRLVVVEARPTPRPARLTVATAAGATLAIDGVLRGSGAGVIELAPGRHRVWAGARGRLGVEEVLTLAPGQARRLELALRVSPRRRAARWVGVGAAALTALGAGAAGWAAVQAERASDLRGVLSTRPWTEAELGTYSDARDGRATWRGLAIGGFASAAVTAAVAGWLWIDDVPRPRP